MKVLKGIKPIGWQTEFVSQFKSLNPSEILFVVSARQRGKSTILLQILLYVAINRPNSVSFFVSPTNAQNRSRFKDLQKLLGGTPLVSKLNESTFDIKFFNNSTVTFLSAESGDNLRGNTVSRGGILIIDEAAFIKDDTITSVLSPYVTVHHANIIAVSTPRRKSGWFYEGVRDAISHKEPLYKCVDASMYDNSFFISEEQIELARRKYPPEKFKNEILGLFSEDGDGVFGSYRTRFATYDTEPVYIGIDWSTGSSSKSDQTVVVGFDKDLHMSLLFKDNTTTDPIERCNLIANLLNKHNSIKKIVVERNSMGAVYSSYLKKQLKSNLSNKVSEFDTTNTSKVRIIEQLVEYINTNKLTLLPDNDLDYEFGIFISSPLKDNKYTYLADPKASNSHDDIVLATSFALEAYAISQKSGGYSFTAI